MGIVVVLVGIRAACGGGYGGGDCGCSGGGGCGGGGLTGGVAW